MKITGREMMKAVKGLGFENVSYEGNYHIMEHKETDRRVAIPVNQEILEPQILAFIMRELDVAWTDIEIHLNK